MADTQRHGPGPATTPGTDDRDQRPAAPVQPDGLSGGVTDIDQRDGEADDSDSGYSDEDLLRTGGGGRAR